MKILFMFMIYVLFALDSVYAQNSPAQFDTKWISAKPEMLTYRSTSKQGDGLYQVSIVRNDNAIETYINIITNGFTKTVSGSMGLNFDPMLSQSKIIVSGQIVMNTDCVYDKGGLHIQTEMKPYNQTMKNDIAFSGLVVDFSQVPFLPRLLPLKLNAEYSFQSLDPKTNQLVPLSLKVVGEEKVQHIDCFKIESHDFEGKAYLWIEKSGSKRVIRFEQPETNRVTDLIL